VSLYDKDDSTFSTPRTTQQEGEPACGGGLQCQNRRGHNKLTLSLSIYLSLRYALCPPLMYKREETDPPWEGWKRSPPTHTRTSLSGLDTTCLCSIRAPWPPRPDARSAHPCSHQRLGASIPLSPICNPLMQIVA